jgi:hypothetical protein
VAGRKEAMSGLGNFNPLSRASFSSREQEFHEIAIRGVDGYDNFGDPSYLEGLRRLLYSYDHEARLHTTGKMTAVYQTVGLLASRLHTERWFEMRPDSANVAIERPIIITGMVRTGSTALHYLMGSNPDMQCLQYWLALHPQPRPPRAYWEAATDFQHARIELDMMYQAGKSMLEAIHFMMPYGPDESGRASRSCRQCRPTRTGTSTPFTARPISDTNASCSSSARMSRKSAGSSSTRCTCETSTHCSRRTPTLASFGRIEILPTSCRRT